MIFYDSKSDTFYWKDEYSVVPEGSRRIDDDAKDYYIDNRETLKINLDNVPGDIITVEGIMYNTMMAKKCGDSPSAWAKDSAETAKEKGIFIGDGNGNFAWQKPVSREMLACVLKRAGVI